MKIIIIEAGAEELRADRTLGESIRAAVYRAVEAFGARTDTAAELSFDDILNLIDLADGGADRTDDETVEAVNEILGFSFCAKGICPAMQDNGECAHDATLRPRVCREMIAKWLRTDRKLSGERIETMKDVNIRAGGAK